jgi:hypothetical protein
MVSSNASKVTNVLVTLNLSAFRVVFVTVNWIHDHWYKKSITKDRCIDHNSTTDSAKNKVFF